MENNNEYQFNYLIKFFFFNYLLKSLGCSDGMFPRVSGGPICAIKTEVAISKGQND